MTYELKVSIRRNKLSARIHSNYTYIFTLFRVRIDIYTYTVFEFGFVVCVFHIKVAGLEFVVIKPRNPIAKISAHLYLGGNISNVPLFIYSPLFWE